MTPRILISASGKGTNYIEAASCGGAEPILYVGQDISSDYDGLILCGGADINPQYYGEEMNGAESVNAQRDTAEFALAKAFVEAGKPILGICRGCQLLNVYFGGSLIQHLDNTCIHLAEEGDLVHPSVAEPGSVLHELYGREFPINSAHHQAIKKVGKGLRITQWAQEVPEAIEHESLPILAVQWHPERLSLGHRRPDAVDGIEVFRYFVDLCRKRGKTE